MTSFAVYIQACTSRAAQAEVLDDVPVEGERKAKILRGDNRHHVFPPDVPWFLQPALEPLTGIRWVLTAWSCEKECGDAGRRGRHDAG